MTPEEVLVEILEAVRHTDPLNLRRAELLTMRQRVIELASAGFEPSGLPEVERRKSSQDSDYVRAVGIVLSYRGTNRFVRDLARSIETYGGLTVRQAQAVLGPPLESQEEQLERLGFDPAEVIYRWQAEDLIADATKLAAEVRS